MVDLQTKLMIGPAPNEQYPRNVLYCGNCSMPLEYCEFYPEFEKCKHWLEKNMPVEFSRLDVKTSEEPSSGRQKVNNYKYLYLHDTTTI